MTAPHASTVPHASPAPLASVAPQTSPAPRTSAPEPKPIDSPPTDDEIRAARRAVAVHRRRRYPDTAVCGLCGYWWQTSRTRSGKPSAGCARRRRALNVLDAADLLDSQGRLAAPLGRGTR